ncbi:MAG: nucleoside hydrolase [Chloroflexota bacterium]
MRVFVRVLMIVIIGLTTFTFLPLGNAAYSSTKTDIFIDADPGVDDAVAIAWLLEEPSANIVGISTVAGNTTVEDATRNTLSLLEVAERSDIAVTIGAAAPLEFPLSRVGIFVHGPDGIWGAQQPQDLSNIPTDAPAAIAEAARDNPGMTILALGPLTNVAQAIEQYPEDMANSNILALVGAQNGGNRTPVAETNAFIDPQALTIVLESDVDLTLVPLDAFEQLQVSVNSFPRVFERRFGPVGEFLSVPLQQYFLQIQEETGTASIPDAVAAILALQPQLGPTTSALIDSVENDDITRGQTVIETVAFDKIPMIADDAELSALIEQSLTDPDFDLEAALGAILARRPDNAQVILNINERAALRALIQGL